MRQASERKPHERYPYDQRSSDFSSGFGSGIRHKTGSQSDNYRGYQGESNHYTDDQGYHTAATTQSRSMSQNSAMQAKLIKGLNKFLFMQIMLYFKTISLFGLKIN